MQLDVDTAHAAFAESTDFTVGLEEEFALLDPGTLDLVPRFEELREAAAADSLLAASIAGELISSEIEIRSGRGEDLAAATVAQRDRHSSVGGLPRAAADRHRALPPGGERAQVRGVA